MPVSGRWLSLGPAPVYHDPFAGNESGRVTSLAAAGGDLYAGSAGGGVWVTSDDGRSWRPLSDRTVDLAIGALAVQPKPEVIYAGTGENNDCGDCFFSDGIERSVDGGRNWQLLGQKTFYGHYLSSILLDPGHPRRIFAAGDLGIEVSENGGVTWRPVLRLATTDLAWLPGPPRELLAGVEGVGVEVSRDLGRTWHVLAGGLPRQSSLIGRVALAVAPSDPRTVYVSMATLSHRCTDCLMGLYVTHDGGQSFQKLRPPDFLREPDSSPPQAQGDYDQVLAVAPGNPEELFAGGVDLMVTTNGGGTWADLTQRDYLHTDQHALLFAAHGLYIGNDGGVYRLTPENTLKDLNTNLSITEVYPAMAVSPHGNRVLAGFQDNGTAVYNRRTGRWTSLIGGDGGFNAFVAGQPALLIGEADGSLQRSRSRGRRWGSAQPPVGALGVGAFAVDPKRPNILLAGGQQIWRSTRDGGAWQRVTHLSGTGPLTVIAFAPGSGSVAYAGWQNGQVALSENAGLTWRLISPQRWPTLCTGAGGADLYITDVAAAPDDPYRAFVSIAFGMPQSLPDCPYVFETAAANASWPSWTEIAGNLPQFSVLGLYAAPNGLAAATGGGVFWSPSRDASWLPLGRALPNVQTTTLTGTPSGGLLLGTYGRGVWQLSAAKRPKAPVKRSDP